MRIESRVPAWAGWMLGALIWAGIGAHWFLGGSSDDMRPFVIGLAGLASFGYVVRGVYAYARRNEPPKERALREDPDWLQLLIFVLVAAVVVGSVVLGFEVLAILGDMQR